MSDCRQAAPIVYFMRYNFLFIWCILLSLKGDDLRMHFRCLIGVVVSDCKQAERPGWDIEAVQTGWSGRSGWKKMLQREIVRRQGYNQVMVAGNDPIHPISQPAQNWEGKKRAAEDSDVTHFSVGIWFDQAVKRSNDKFQIRSTINDLVSPNTFSSRIVHPGKRAANSLLDNKVRFCSVSSIFFWSGLVINPHTLKYRTNLRFTGNGNQWTNNVRMCGSIGNHLFGVWQ